MSPRRRRRRDAVPDWAQPLAAEEYRAFRGDLEHALRLYYEHRIDDAGVLTLRGVRGRFPIGHLLELWRHARGADRRPLVERSLARRLAPDAASPDDPRDGPLRPRLWSAATLAAAGVELVARELAEDLVAVVCVDLPDAVIPLSAARAARLPLEEPELWREAIAQIDDGLPVEVERVDSGLAVHSGESLFVASRLLELDRFVGALPAAGAVVAVPDRQLLLVRPLDDLGVVTALGPMVALAARLAERGAGPIVEHLYWWRPGGSLTRLPADAAASGVMVEPPDAFLAALNELPPAAE